jgi:hypothetical protein
VNKLQGRRSWESVSHLRAWTSLRLWVLILVSREILKVERKFSSSLEAEYCLWRRASEGQEVLVHKDKDIFQQNAFCTYKGLEFHIFDGDGVADLEALCLSAGERDGHGAQQKESPMLDSMAARYFSCGAGINISMRKGRSGKILPQFLDSTEYSSKETTNDQHFH